MPTTADKPAASPLGIVAAGGPMPRLLADKVSASGRAVILIGLGGFFDADPGDHPCKTFSPGEVGGVFAALRQAGCQEVVMIGNIRRPRLADLRFDLGALRHLPVLFKIKGRGDDGAMRLVTNIFESGGFRVVSLKDVAPELAAPRGLIGTIVPDMAAAEAITFGFSLLRTLSAFDVGQAAVIHRRRVLAIEGAEGTTMMIERVGTLRDKSGEAKRLGILVKTPKASQELRNDMPVIGPRTIDAAREAGLVGIAVLAGGVALAEPQILGARADAAGLFLVGCDEEGHWR